MNRGDYPIARAPHAPPTRPCRMQKWRGRQKRKRRKRRRRRKKKKKKRKRKRKHHHCHLRTSVEGRSRNRSWRLGGFSCGSSTGWHWNHSCKLLPVSTPINQQITHQHLNHRLQHIFSLLTPTSIIGATHFFPFHPHSHTHYLSI